MQQLKLTRRQDWPERLAACVAAAQERAYLLGVHDCLRFSCACIQAMTGVDFWPRFAGYSTRLQALRAIVAIAPSLAQAVSVVLQVSSAPPQCGRRGDLLLYRDAEGEHLGVCVGRTVAVLGPLGLVFVSLDCPDLINSWRVG